MIENPELIAGLDKKLVNLIDWLENYAKNKNTSLVLSSGKRNGTGSWHTKGLAVDLYFKDINCFKLCSDLYYYCERQESVFKGLTEFEMCRDYVPGRGAVQHFHFAFGNEPALETFTSNYKGILY